MADSVPDVMTWLNFYPKIKFGTEFFSTRFDLDKEFSHVFRAAVYFEHPGGFLAHFDSSIESFLEMLNFVHTC